MLLRHTDELQRGRNSCLWLQSRSVLSSFGVVLMPRRVIFHVVRSVFCLQNLICLLFIFADQVFIDPTFFGIFVCGPLQSFVVNVCSLFVDSESYSPKERERVSGKLLKLFPIKDL